MPIYDKGYRPFDGELRRRFRWWTIVRQEWSIIRRRRMFWVLMVPPIIYTIVVAIYIYLIDIIAGAQNHPWAETAQQLPITQIDHDVFFNFVRFQTPFVFVLIILNGAGLIANDFRYNLVDVYFSKPLSWVDYVVGKTLTLVLVGLSITALPACFLLLIHFFFVPSWETVTKIYALPFQTLAFSLCIAIPSALCVLASSAFFMSQRFAGITVFMLLLFNSAFGGVLPPLLEKESLFVMSFPVAVNRLGEVVFRQSNPVFDLVSPLWSGVFWAAVCLFSAIIVCRKARSAGAAA